MKPQLLLAALTVALTTSYVAIAAAPDKDTPATAKAVPAEQTAKAEPAKKKIKPHSHVEAKGGVVIEQPTEAKSPLAKPLHDHQKVHKQM